MNLAGFYWLSLKIHWLSLLWNHLSVVSTLACFKCMWRFMGKRVYLWPDLCNDCFVIDCNAKWEALYIWILNENLRQRPSVSSCRMWMFVLNLVFVCLQHWNINEFEILIDFGPKSLFVAVFLYLLIFSLQSVKVMWCLVSYVAGHVLW